MPRAVRLEMTSVVLLITAFRPLSAQSFSSAANTSQTVPSPTAAMYSATAPNNVTGANTAPNFGVTMKCQNGNGHACRLDLAFGANPGQLKVQWKLVSASGCDNNTPTAAFQDIPFTAIVTSTGSSSCNLTFQFQVAGLSYSLNNAPGPGGIATPYAQAIVFTVFQTK